MATTIPKANNYPPALTSLFALLLVYVSLFPFSGWEFAGNPFAWLSGPLPHHISRKDALVNLLAYIPLGYLVSRCCLSTVTWRTPVISSLLTGLCLSFVMESLQSFLPARNPSLIDLATNSCGAVIGAVLAVFCRKSLAPGGTLHRMQDSWLTREPSSRLGAVILLLWALARLAPFIPSRPWPGPFTQFSPLWLTLHGKLPFHYADALVYCCQATGLALLTAAIMQAAMKPMRFFATALAAVLALRFIILSGCLTLEEMAGYTAGIVAAIFLSRLSGDLPRFVAVAALSAGIILFELKAGETPSPSGQFNWIPFRYYLDNTLAAIGQILEGLWPFSALALLWIKLTKMTGKDGMIYGGAVLVLGVLLLEWQQQYIPGRTADVTPALLALIGWSWPFWLQEDFRNSGGVPENYSA